MKGTELNDHVGGINVVYDNDTFMVLTIFTFQLFGKCVPLFCDLQLSQLCRHWEHSFFVFQDLAEDHLLSHYQQVSS